MLLLRHAEYVQAPVHGGYVANQLDWVCRLLLKYLPDHPQTSLPENKKHVRAMREVCASAWGGVVSGKQLGGGD